MGFISDLANSSSKAEFAGTNQGLATWREIFGNTDKERVKPERPVIPGGSYGRSMLTSDASYKRLLQAMRSMAPGGWSDDRYEQSKHYVGITYTAIHRQNEMLSQAEFQVFIRDPQHPEGKRPVTENDPPQGDRLVKPYDLVKLLQNPNRDDSFGDLMASWNLQMDLTGMALTWMVPNQIGTPHELYPIPTALAIPQPAINPDYPDGYYRIQPLYPYGPFSSYPTPATAVGAPIPAQWMLRFKYPHPLLRYDGYSPQTAMRLHCDEIEGIDRSRWYKMKRSINPSAVLQLDEMEGSQPLPEDEINRIVAEFESDIQGTENAGRLFVSAPGGRLEEWGSRPVDMEYQSGWDQLTSFVLGAGFGITRPAAGMIEDSSYSTLYATLKQLYWLTLDPKCSRIANKLTIHLAKYFGDNLIVEVRCRRIDDHEVKMAKLDKLMMGKAIKKNELRQELDMPTTEEIWGNDMAGDATPQELQQIQRDREMQGGVPPGQANVPTQDNPERQKMEYEKQESEETARTWPRTGDMGRGSMGPDMGSVASGKKKGIYERVIKSLKNGNGVH